MSRRQGDKETRRQEKAEKNGRPIVVYPLPPQLLTSPYLDQLYASMPEFGIDVRRGRPRVELPRLLLGRGPHILHLHFFDELTQRAGALTTAVRTLGFLALLFLLRLRGVRIIWTAHNLAPHEAPHPLWGFFAYRTVARWSDAIVAHSQAAHDTLEATYGPLPQATIISHGSYVDLYGPMRDRTASRAELGLPLDGSVLLNFGTLRPYKGLETLLDAFAALPEHAHGQLVIAGDAKDQLYGALLERRAREIDGVRLDARFIPDAELPAYLAAADAIVLPYHHLLTSGVLLWAMSYGRAVVAPAFGPVRELVRDGETGLLFTPGDVQSLRHALERALAHPDLDVLGRNGLALAREFGWPRIAEQTAGVYRSVARERL